MNQEARIILTFRDDASAGIRMASTAISGALTGMEKITSGVASTLQSVWKKAGSVVRGVFDSMFGGANKWASFFVGAAFLGVGNSLLEMAGKFERFGKAAEFLTGSTKEADKFAQSVRNIAKETMFNIDQIAEMNSRLVGNTKNVDLSDKALRALTEAVAATGGGYSELEGATRAWIQVNSKAKVSSEELNRQFANANIPIIRLLAESIVKDVNNPLRKYIEVSGGAGTASKVLTKDFQKATDASKEWGLKLDELEKKLEKAKSQHEENSVEVRRAKFNLDEYGASIKKQEATIKSYTDAQKSAGTATKATSLTVEEVMKQLQEVGDLNIPGSIGAAAITAALQQAYGGANKELIKTFDGQISLLKDTVKLVALSFVGLDKNFRPVKGGLLDILKNGLTPLITFLNEHQDDISKFAENFHKSIPLISALAGIIVGIFMPAIIGLVGPIVQMAVLWGAFGVVVGLVIEKLGGIGVVAGKFRDAFDQVKTTVNNVKDIIVKNKDVIVGAIKAVAFVLGVLLVQHLALLGTAALAFVANFLVVNSAFLILMATIMLVGGAIGWIRSRFQQLKESGVFLGIVIAGVGVALLALIPIFSALTVIFAANPFGALVLVLSTLVMGFGFLSTQTDIFKTKTELADIASRNFAKAQDNLRRSNKDLEDALRGVSDAELQVEGSTLGVERAQRNYNDAVKQYGPDSLEAKEASYNLKEAQNRLRDAHGEVVTKQQEVIDKQKEWVKAQDEAKGVQDKANEALKTHATIWEKIGNAIGDAINKLGEYINKSTKNGAPAGNFSWKAQHGGIVPGDVGQAVPIIAHGGEMIVPRGSNSQSPFGGGGGAVTINISGSFNLDSEDRINQLADKIVKTLGRQSELARYGVGYSMVA